MPLAAHAQQPSIDQSYTIWPKWAPFLDLDAKVGTQRDIGEADLFVPFWQDEKSMLFGDFRFRADNENSNEGNFGAGYRQMLDGGWNIGGYSYYDHRHSSTGNLFDQLTFGAELLGRDFDFRANLYSPIGQTQQLLSTTSMGPITAQVVGSSLQVTEPGILATFEYALRGFDAEAGVRIPITEAESPYALRFYAGGFRFDEPTGVVPVVSGPRLRLEFTDYELPVWGGSRLTAEVDWQTDPVRGSQVFGGLRLRVPLWPEPKRSTMTMQERRMTEPTVRDVDIVAQSATIQQTPTVTTTATSLANGQAINIISSANTSGANFQTALNAAGQNSFVVISGTFNTGASQTNLQPGQSVMGTGALSVRTASGRTVTADVIGGGTISGALGGSTPLVAVNGGALSGVSISNIASDNIGVSGVLLSGGGTLTGNTITVTNTGAGGALGISGNIQNSSAVVSNNSVNVSSTGVDSVGIALNLNSGNLLLSGNKVNVNAPTGTVALTLVGVGGSIATVSGNALNATGGASNIAAHLTNTIIAAGSTGNTRTGGCANGLGNTGNIFFTDGTHCP